MANMSSPAGYNVFSKQIYLSSSSLFSGTQRMPMVLQKSHFTSPRCIIGENQFLPSLPACSFAWLLMYTLYRATPLRLTTCKCTYLAYHVSSADYALSLLQAIVSKARLSSITLLWDTGPRHGAPTSVSTVSSISRSSRCTSSNALTSTGNARTGSSALL